MVKNCVFCENSKTKHIADVDGMPLLKCKCGLWFLDVKFSNEDLHELYDDFYQKFDAKFKKTKVWKTYEDENKHMSKRIVAKKYIDFIKKFKPIGNLLDVGSSTGALLNYAKSQGFKCEGIEISKVISDFTREIYGLNIFTGTLEECNFELKFFDVITCMATLEHMENPYQSLKLMGDYLKDDGVLYIVVPNLNRAFLKLNRWRTDSNFHKGHLFYFSPAFMKKLLNKAGYDVIYIRTGLITKLVDDVLKKFNLSKSVAKKAIQNGNTDNATILSLFYKLIKAIDRTNYGHAIEVVAVKKNW